MLAIDTTDGVEVNGAQISLFQLEREFGNTSIARFESLECSDLFCQRLEDLVVVSVDKE